MSLFLSLPVECIVHLSNWLDFEDYLSLRGTTKAVSRLILPSTHALQEDIAAKIPQLLPRNTPLSDQSAYNIIRARPSRIFHLNSLDLKLTQIACSTLLLRGRSLDWITDQVQQASVNLKATFKTCVSLGFFSQYSEKNSRNTGNDIPRRG